MNLTEEAGKQIEALVREACASAVKKGLLPAGTELKGTAEVPRDPARGDFACSCAMRAAGTVGMSSRKLAGLLASELDLAGSWFDRAEAAGAGFLNFHLGDAWYARVLESVEAEGESFGSADEGRGKTVLVESVSAGRGTAGDLRAAVLGDALAAVLAKAGWQVRRERRVGDGACADYAAEGFDSVVSIRSPDLRDRALRLDGSLSAPGAAPALLRILPVQPVDLTRAGQSVRGGRDIPEEEILNELPQDALRFFFCAGADTPLEVDLDLAGRRDGGNPLYLVQYAHARVCALVSGLAAGGHFVPTAGEADVSLLSGEAERALIKQLSLLPEEVRLAARSCDPGRVSRYLMELALRFRRFYAACPIRGAEPGVLEARLKLADSVRAVLALGLGILGVSAPERG